MSDFKQSVTKFQKGLENRLHDKVKKASVETVAQNAMRDDKCTGIKRTASAGCCPICADKEGTRDKDEALKDGFLSLHTRDQCHISPVFGSPDFVLTREMIDDAQYGQKMAQHARDFKLDPRTEEGREQFCAILLSTVNDCDEVVRGTWRDRPQGVDFYIKGEVVVVMDGKEFITILDEGARNRRVIRARAKRQK